MSIVISINNKIAFTIFLVKFETILIKNIKTFLIWIQIFEMMYFQVRLGRSETLRETECTIFRKYFWIFENGLKASVKAHPKSLQLRALRDTPAKAPENVWGDFPKSNSTKSSQKYQNILWTKDAAILCKHFLRLWQLKIERKVLSILSTEKGWIMNRNWHDKYIEGREKWNCEKVKRTFKCGDNGEMVHDERGEWKKQPIFFLNKSE